MLMLWLYRIVTYCLGPLLPMLLRYRLVRGKENPERLAERLGYAAFPRPAGPLVWLHAASIGESTSILPLIAEISERAPSFNLLLTTVTVSSAQLMGKKLPEKAFHQFAPLDHPAVIRRFLKHWKPDAALWVESELWPNMLTQTAASGCKIVMVNGRLSEDSARRWRRFRPLLARLLDCFAAFYPQSETDALRLKSLGAGPVEYLGNLKYDGAPLPADPKAMGEVLTLIGGRPLWLAASTHPGEEEICARVQHQLQELHPGLLTVIVPRHATRGPAIAAMLRGRGFLVSLRSAGESVVEETQIYIADTIGELGLFYRIAGIVFMGGSLVPHGGQNPLEAARLDCALLCGPHMENFRAICEDMKQANACRQVATGTELAEAVEEWLRHQDRQDAAAKAALDLLEKRQGVAKRLMEKIAPLLQTIAAAREPAGS